MKRWKDIQTSWGRIRIHQEVFIVGGKKSIGYRGIVNVFPHPHPEGAGEGFLKAFKTEKEAWNWTRDVAMIIKTMLTNKLVRWQRAKERS